MQKVSFNSIEEFMDFLPPKELQIVNYLRNLIFDCVPGITEKLSYNVPFYKGNKGMFFIWPASVLWGSRKTYTGVRFGFQQGFQLNDEMDYLDKENRKQVYMKDFVSIDEIETGILKYFIFEAAKIDAQFKPGSKSRESNSINSGIKRMKSHGL